MAFTSLNGKLTCWNFKNGVYVIWERTSDSSETRSPSFQYFKEKWQIETVQCSPGNPNKVNIAICNCTRQISSRKRTWFLFELNILLNNNFKQMESEIYFYQDQWKHIFQQHAIDASEKFTVWCRISHLENKSEEKGLRDECSHAGVHTLSDDLKAVIETGKHSDVVLKLGEVTFPAHKMILSCRSKVFEAMFDHDCKENLENTVDLVDMDVAVAKSMLQYIYTGQFPELSWDNAIQLYSVADRYCLMVVTQCRECMLSNMDVDNVGEMAATADLHSDDVLMGAVQRFFGANLKEILKSDKHKEFSKNNPILVLKIVQEAVLLDHNTPSSNVSLSSKG